MLATKFIIDGADVFVHRINSEHLSDKLPPAIYSVRETMVGFFLTTVAPLFRVPERVYGKVNHRVERCIKTFQDRQISSTGILMTGDKGTGKTLTLSLIANAAVRDLNLPVVMIREPYIGERFEHFIHSLGEICLVFDEFGKMYPNISNSDEKEGVSQNRMLSLLDGADRVRRLVIMTENNEIDICEAILNRPSRAYYHFRFDKLDDTSIKEFCKDRLVGEKEATDIVNFSRRCKIFSFDMLQSIVEEQQRFGESIEDLVEDLNVEMAMVKKQMIRVLKIIHKATGQEVQLDLNQSDMIRKPTQFDSTYVHIRVPMTLVQSNDSSCRPVSEAPKKRKEKDEEYDSRGFYLEEDNIISINMGKYVYDTGEYVVVTQLPMDNPFINQVPMEWLV